MENLIKGAIVLGTLAGVGYMSYRRGSKDMNKIIAAGMHKIAGRYGDPMDPATWGVKPEAAEGTK